MTEHEWLACEAPERMLRLVCHRSPRRKVRLFAVACARRVAHLLPNTRVADALAVADRVADLTTDPAEWQAAEEEVRRLRGRFDPSGNHRRWDAATAALIVIFPALAPPDVLRLALVAATAAARAAGTGESAAQAALVREVIGNPFCPVAFAPEWRTDTAVAVAAGMYESRDFGAMPILADALQDAGCHSEPVLAHCRDPHPHVRGCWVVDAVLGRE